MRKILTLLTAAVVLAVVFTGCVRAPAGQPKESGGSSSASDGVAGVSSAAPVSTPDPVTEMSSAASSTVSSEETVSKPPRPKLKEFSHVGTYDENGYYVPGGEEGKYSEYQFRAFLTPEAASRRIWYSPSSFPDVDILTVEHRYYPDTNFAYLYITLKTPGGQQVLDAMDAMEQYDIVEYTEVLQYLISY